MVGSHQYHHLTSTGLYRKGVSSIGTQSTKDELSQKDPETTEKRKIHTNMNHLSLLSSFPDLQIGKT
jgi:hypothetical protein